MKKEFKTESKRLLDLMIHSIYTHHEIFIRELISNASDAIDKLYYKSLKENLNLSNFQIRINIDEEKRILEIADNGIGMDEQELEENLGTIAKSGSLDFKSSIDKNDVDIIGQFGVGFYSSFMVADKIEVISKKYGSELAYIWTCDSNDGYSIASTTKEQHGTTIRLYLKANNEDVNYDDYLNQYFVADLIKKYSDYIRYPIMMEMSEPIYDEEGKIKEHALELQTLNSMLPIWKKNKSEITTEEYNEFYKNKFYDMQDPIKTIHYNVEGNVAFNALLYIPSALPYNFYSNEFKKGLQLYSSGVFINDSIEQLLPEHFRFVKGLVDSYDLSLNISREILQHDRQLSQIAKNIEKKIKNELLLMLRNNREDYERFWEVFGSQIKYGIYQEFGRHKEFLQDLLIFKSSKTRKYVTLAEYIENKKEKVIYYAGGENEQKILNSPQIELLIKKDYEILLLTDRIDEFALSMMRDYQEFTFKNAFDTNVEVLNEDELQQLNQVTETNKTLLESLKEHLSDQIESVVISKKLDQHPVCLSTKDGISLEMEKTLKAFDNQEQVQAKKVLELNYKHPIFTALQKIYQENPNDLKDYAELLLAQALLLEGIPLANPLKFSELLTKLMVKVSQ